MNSIGNVMRRQYTNNAYSLFYEQQCGSNAHIIRRMLENCRGDIRPCGSFLLIGKVLKKFVNRCPNLGCSDFKPSKCILKI